MKLRGGRVGAMFIALAVAESAAADGIITKGDTSVLAVEVRGDSVAALTCAAKDAKTCAAEGGTMFRPPAAVRPNLASAKVRAVRTSRGKEIALVTVPAGATSLGTPQTPRTWMLLLAPGGENYDTRVVWTGYTGGSSGNEVTFDKDGAGEKLHIVTHISLCDRNLPAADLTLDPSTLELKAKAMPDPVVDARKTATTLKGTLLHRPGSASGPRPEDKAFSLLRATSASSGTAANATDGDPSTTWHPEGSGFESLTLSAPESVAATGVRIAFDATDRAATPPQSLLVFVGDKEPISVDFPEPTKAGDEVIVTFKEPIHARCVGIVMGPENAKAPSGKPGHGRLDVSEVALTTQFDAKSLDDIAKGLDGSETGRARADLLAASGKAGLEATMKAYPGLDGGGQESARRVIDAASCTDKLPFYVPLLAAKDRGEADRAHERVEQCGKESVTPLVAKLGAEKGDTRAIYTEELGLIAPDEAVPVLIAALAASEAPGDRMVFRRGLVKAAKRQRSVRAFDAALEGDAFSKLSPTTQIDVLRGMGERIGETSGGAATFEKVWKASASDFRARYLLLQPAAELASKGVAFARDTIAAAITKDDDPRIRAHAADVAKGNKDFAAALTQASSDKDARVREASQRSLATAPVGVEVQRSLANALGAEVWTFVKRASLAALASSADDATVDATLAKAIELEDQPIVRSDILNALGARGATSARETILARAADDGEALFVRVAALEALGGLCDTQSLPDLTKLAQKGSTAGTESEAKLSMAAIAALGKIHPANLEKILAPDLLPGVIADVRSSARAAIAEEHTCKAH